MKRLLALCLALLTAILCLSQMSTPAFADNAESRVITITKQPYGEIVTEGEDALFVARARGNLGLIWQLVSPDGQTVFNNDEALNAFPGLDMAGYETEELTLISIPYSLNGWSVRAKFIDTENDYAMSDPAPITVIRGLVPSPEVTPKSSGARLTLGEKKTLSVEATSPGGDTLKYQWYRSYSAARNSGEPILGATEAHYTPPEELGQRFYYVGVWCVNGRMSSAPIYTTPVAIVYTAPAATPEPQPTAETTAPPAPTRSGSGSSLSLGHNALRMLLGGLALLTVIAVTMTVLILRTIGKRRGGGDKPEGTEARDGEIVSASLVDETGGTAGNKEENPN